MRTLALLTFTCFAAIANAADSEPTTVESLVQLADADEFLGAEFRQAVTEAGSLKLDTAGSWQKLQPVLLFCGGKVDTDKASYVSVSNKAELAQYAESHPDKASITAIDIACPRAYTTAAFLAVRDADASKAFHFLDRAQALAPYWPDPYTERGFLLNTSGDRAAALIAYRRAVELADKYKGSPSVKAMAMRGIGWTLVEMGDLPGARKAYEDSLIIQPGNLNAKKELAYIAGLEKDGGPLPKSPVFAANDGVLELTGDPAKVVRYTRFLEAQPLHDDAPAMRAWLIEWIAEAPDVEVTICDILGPIPGQKLPYSSELLVQMMFANAAFQLEHPEQKDDALAVQVAGARGAIKAYSNIINAHPEAKIRHFDDLLAHEIAGDLKAAMTAVVNKNCSSADKAKAD